MKKFILTVLILLCVISAVFSIDWRWKQQGNEFLLLSPSGDVELGFKIKKAFMPIKLYMNNNRYLYFVDAEDFLRAYKLRPKSGSAIMDSLISIELNEEWGEVVSKNSKNVKNENEIGLKFSDGKTRIFAIDTKSNQFELIRESYY
ncbi:MAG TPA: hypothetical protein PK466_04820 [Thermotogota bacterium]|nr:hypothetical protein [Thermotogota bacterium]HPR95630.1 hypothetical protein [Thermotogota bacterium]